MKHLTYIRGGFLANLGVAASLLLLLIGTTLAGQRTYAVSGCLSNLRRIGQATALYTSDFDGFYPAAYSSVQNPLWSTYNWSWRLEPYLRAGATAALDKNDGYDTSEGHIGRIDFGWADSGGPTWHCPTDHDGANMSYGTNPFISGADERQEEDIRVPAWRPSLAASQIPDPEETLWAGDTNKEWHEDAGRYYKVYADWMRDRDLPTIDGRPRTRAEIVDWYRAYLKEDNTDIRGECLRPGGWGCKGPAYRHDRNGVGTGKAGMVFCDGHVKAMPFGSITVRNVFPELGGSKP